MTIPREGGLLAWQFRDYAERHQDKLNLWLHLYSVPVFIAGLAAAFANLLELRWFGVAVSLGFVLVAVAMQALGHRRETRPAPPIDGPLDGLRQIVAEQFVTFPRFVLSGGWMRNVTRRARHH
jgi:uncharacterized membrane protein YGL010W